MLLGQDFYTKGFQEFYAPELLFSLDNIIWKEGPEDIDPANEKEYIDFNLNLISTTILSKYLDDSKYVPGSYRRLWQGIHHAAHIYHTHYLREPGIFFLLYFNDMTKYDSGSIYFCDQTTKQEWEVRPKAGTLIAINNEEAKFMHKAEHPPEGIDRPLLQVSFARQGITREEATQMKWVENIDFEEWSRIRDFSNDDMEINHAMNKLLSLVKEKAKLI